MLKPRMTRAEFETNLLLLKFNKETSHFLTHGGRFHYSYSNNIHIAVYGHDAANLRVNSEYRGAYNFEIALKMVVNLLEDYRDKRRVNN